MSDPGTFGGTDDLVPSAEELAERRPVEAPASHDDAGSVLFDDDPVDSSLAPDGAASSQGTAAMSRPAHETTATASASTTPASPVWNTGYPGAPARPVEKRTQSWPTLTEGAPRTAERQALATQPAAPPRPVPVVTEEVDWRATQFLWALGRGVMPPIFAVAFATGLDSHAAFVALVIVGLVLGVPLLWIYLRVAIAARRSRITIDEAGVGVDAGWQSFTVPWSQVESATLEERALKGRYGSTATAFLQVVLAPGSDVFRRCRGAWIYRTLRGNVLEVPIATQVAQDLAIELTKFSGRGHGAG